MINKKWLFLFSTVALLFYVWKINTFEPVYPLNQSSIVESEKHRTLLKLAKEKASENIDSSVISDKNPYILSCETENIGEDFLLGISDEEINNIYYDIEKYRALLKESSDYQSQLVYVQLEDFNGDDETKYEILSGLLNDQPNNPMANWLVLVACQSRSQHETCSQKNLDNALKVQQHNAAVWINVIRPEQPELNFKALEMIVSSPIFNEYYSENIKLYNQVLIRNGAIDITLRSTSSIGFAAASSMSSFAPLFNYCRAAIDQRADILQLCLDAGRRMSNNAKTILVRAIGDALQKIVLESYEDVDGLKRLELEGIKSKYLNSSLWHKASSLLIFDTNLSEKWFDNLTNYGEIRAADLLIEEAIFLSSDKRYNPCDSHKDSN